MYYRMENRYILVVLNVNFGFFYLVITNTFSKIFLLNLALKYNSNNILVKFQHDNLVGA